MSKDYKKSSLPVPTLNKGRDRNIWREQLYRYVEHYIWEPQHLINTPMTAWKAGQRGESRKEAFYHRIRTQEVPLNFLLNLVLRVAPASARLPFLRQFCVDGTQKPSGSPQLLYAEDQDFTQPDVLLSTRTQRFLVELKVSGSGSTNQVEKYAQLHAYLDQIQSPLEPHLYFLTRGPIARAWKPKSDRAPIMRNGLQTFVRDALLRGRSQSGQPLLENVPSYQEAYDRVANSLQVGHATWQTIGDCLLRELDGRLEHGGELAEVMHALFGDFLVDLEARRLWKP